MKNTTFTNQTIEVCRTCGGEGALLEFSATILKDVVCPTCKGEGMVTVIRKIEVTILPKSAHKSKTLTLEAAEN